MFKKDFVILNQILCQKANNLVEKDFYKLMNDSNFSYDCKNSIDNCTFTPISKELEEILYLKKYQSPFDTLVSKFVLCELSEQEIRKKNFHSTI